MSDICKVFLFLCLVLGWASLNKIVHECSWRWPVCIYIIWSDVSHLPLDNSQEIFSEVQVRSAGQSSTETSWSLNKCLVLATVWAGAMSYQDMGYFCSSTKAPPEPEASELSYLGWGVKELDCCSVVRCPSFRWKSFGNGAPRVWSRREAQSPHCSSPECSFHSQGFHITSGMLCFCNLWLMVSVAILFMLLTFTLNNNNIDSTVDIVLWDSGSVFKTELDWALPPFRTWRKSYILSVYFVLKGACSETSISNKYLGKFTSFFVSCENAGAGGVFSQSTYVYVWNNHIHLHHLSPCWAKKAPILSVS